MTHDPFPRDRLGATVRRMPAYARLALALATDPRLAKKRRAAVIAAAGYLVSPIDLVPGIIPVLGQLDDLAVAIAALRFALAGLDAERRRAHLAGVGLGDADLAEDLATMGAVTAWSVRAGARTTRRAAVRGGELATSGARAVAGAATAGAAKISPRIRKAAAPIAKRAADATPEAAKAAGARVTPAARHMADRLSPVAKGAATRLGSAARNAASRGAGLARRAGGQAPKVSVSVPPRLGLPAPVETSAGDGEPEPPAG